MIRRKKRLALFGATGLAIVALSTSCASTNQDEIQEDARLIAVSEDNETLKRRLEDMGSVEVALERELNLKKSEADSAKKEAARLRNENARLSSENQRLRSQPRRTDSVRPVSNRATAKPATSPRRRAPQIDFSSIAGNDVKVIDTGDGKLIVRLAGATMFEQASSDLSKGGRAILDKVGDILRANSSVFISVEGHTDATPLGKSRDRWGTNMALSMARALVVQDFLKSREKISETRMRVVGYGEHRPATTGKSAKALAQNRRVELVLSRMAP